MSPATPGPFINLIPLAAVLVIFYIFLIRPQQKEAQEHKKMLDGLKKGDRILTSGGLYGTVLGTRGEDLEVRFAENVKLLVARSHVAKLLNGSAETGAAPAAAAPSRGGGQAA